MEKKKKGFLRPGQTRPFIKPTKKQVEERLARAEELLCSPPYYKHQKIAVLVKEFNIDPFTADGYLSRARALIREALGLPKAEQRIESVEFYRGIIADQDNPVEARLRARRSLDRLLGLPLPEQTEMKIEHSGTLTQVQDVSVDSLKLPLEVRKQILDAVRAKG